MTIKLTNTIGDIIPHKTIRFNGGEIQVRVDTSMMVEGCRIEAMIDNPDTFVELLLLTDAVRRAYPGVPLAMEIPYLPYARQDRVCAPGEALSLSVICGLINAQNYKSVEVWDVHSDVSLALLDRVINIEAWTFLSRIGFANTVLVAPDAGARKRVSECAKRLHLPMVQAEKTRDPSTGAITGTVVHSDHIGDQSFLMVDDICDGGRTFIELAQKLRPLTNSKVMLYVTHGIFSNGIRPLKEHIDQIYCANPFPLVPISSFMTKI